jgi:hypothetical protein
MVIGVALKRFNLAPDWGLWFRGARDAHRDLSNQAFPAANSSALSPIYAARQALTVPYIRLLWTNLEPEPQAAALH